MTTSTEGGMEPWKEEPLSPVWLEIDDLADYGDTNILDDIDLIIKEEPQFNSGWTDGSYSPEGASSLHGWLSHPYHQHQQSHLPEEKTSQLLQEFEDVLSRALTPPDSPQDPISSLHQPPSPPVFFTVQPTQHHLPPPLQGNGGDGGISELDALVAESLGNGDCSSCSGSDSGYEDPDWAPGRSGGAEGSPVEGSSRGGRGRPYPSVEERRARKKEQNKNAATRYRQKKKQEVEVILAEESSLQEKNDRLKVEVQEMQREIRYLKSLMRHMFKAKGIIR